MKVLLFVQYEGDEWPKVAPVPRWISDSSCPSEVRAEVVQHFVEIAKGTAGSKTPQWILALCVAPNWWLVECESSAAGRAIIRESKRGAANTAQLSGGGILASGGNR